MITLYLLCTYLWIAMFLYGLFMDDMRMIMGAYIPIGVLILASLGNLVYNFWVI